VLKPVIQTKELATVEESSVSAKTEPEKAHRPVLPRPVIDLRLPGIYDSPHSLETYAKHLIETLEENGTNAVSPQLAESIEPTMLEPYTNGNGQDGPRNLVNGTASLLGSKKGPLLLRAALLDGDDGLLGEGEGEGCGEAVEILSRHSVKGEITILLTSSRLTQDSLV
jgi:hypothetical protein